MKAVDLGAARASLDHLYLMLVLSPKTDFLPSQPRTPVLPPFNSFSHPSHGEMTHFSPFTDETGLGAQRCRAAPCLAHIPAGMQGAAGNEAAPRAHRWYAGCLVATESARFFSSSPPTSQPVMS